MLFSYIMDDFDIESLKQFIENSNDVHLESSTPEDIVIPFEINSKQFLEFAKYDLTSKSNHHLVNALSNAKRAINCQLDSLLCGFGFFDYSKKELKKKWNFPNKVEKLNQIGVLSPEVLNKINKKRNWLEHCYKNPQEEDVVDALDIATLFIAYTEKFLLCAIIECEPFNDVKKDGFEVKLDYKKGEIIFSDLESDSKNNKFITVVKKKINSDSEEYVNYLKWYISLYTLK